MRTLTDKSSCATGIVWENRTHNCTILKISKIMKKNTRGSYVAAFPEEGKANISHWNNNTVVTLLANWDVAEPPVNK